MALGVLLSGALSTLLRLTAEGVVGVKGGCKVDGTGDIGGEGGEERS